MMKKMILTVVIAAGLLALLLVGLKDIRRLRSPAESIPASGPDNSVETIKFVKNPSPAPQFSIQDLEGHTLSPADWRGKVVLLNFWATWCPPCREEIPDLIKLQTKYAGRLQIIGLSDDTGAVETVKDFVKQTGMNYPVAIASPELEAKF